MGNSSSQNPLMKSCVKGGSKLEQTPMKEQPENVKMFFDGKPVQSKMDDMLNQFQEDGQVQFIGKFQPPQQMDKTKLTGQLKQLTASFPDFTFNPKNVPYKRIEPQGQGEEQWQATIVVTGKHTGQPFAPMPGLTPVEKTDIDCTIGPETFTVYTNQDGKICRLTVEVLKQGCPQGPPGFYVLVGGKMPEMPPNVPDMLHGPVKLQDYDLWRSCFDEHSTLPWVKYGTGQDQKTYKLPICRGDQCNDQETEIFQNIEDKNEIIQTFKDVSMPKFGVMMGSPEFQKMSKDCIKEDNGGSILTEMPQPGSEDKPTSDNLAFTLECNDSAKWIEGFKLHQSDQGPNQVWDYKVPQTRAEFCDDSKTKVYKSTKNANRLLVQVFGVKFDVMGPLMQDPEFQKLTVSLGEKPETKKAYSFAPLPKPQDG